MLDVWRESGTGPSVTAPTNTGTPASRVDSSTRPRVVSSAMGSTSVAFSGQSTKSSCFPPVRAAASAKTVSLRALFVTDLA